VDRDLEVLTDQASALRRVEQLVDTELWRADKRICWTRMLRRLVCAMNWTTGLVCGVSPSSAPSTTTISTPSSWAKPRISLQKERQRIDGSMPRTSTRSRGLSPVTRTTERRVVGQVIFLAPPSMKTVGRLTWKS